MTLYLSALRHCLQGKQKKIEKELVSVGFEPVIIGLAIQKISVIFIDCFHKFY